MSKLWSSIHRLIVARLPEDRLHLHGEHGRYDETPLNVVCKSSESLPSFDALQAGLEGHAEHALKEWNGARLFALSKWSPVTCADTQSKGNQTKILQYEDQVAVLVELAVGALVAVVLACPLQILQRCSANV